MSATRTRASTPCWAERNSRTASYINVGSTFLNLQLLRAIAALAVAYYHSTSEAGLNLSPSIGSHGVDLFFVMSGFIIAHAAARSRRFFLLRRIIRIVPFYWTATLAVFVLALLTPQLLRTTHADYAQLVCSLLFIPRETAHAGMAPTLILGWSLNYEMYFYLVFAVALAMAPRHAPLICGVIIVTVALAIDLAGISHPSLTFYARPLVFEFVYGLCAYYLFSSAQRHIARFERLPTARGVLWCGAIGAALAIALEEAHGGFGMPRFIVAGVPAFVLVVATVFLERGFGDYTQSRAVSLAGESSYILYLIHPYVIYGLLRMTWSTRAPLARPAAFGLVIALLGISTAIAMAIHLRFEKPILTRLRRWLLHPDQLRDLARRWDLDLLLRTYLFIPRKMLRDAVREFGTKLEGRMLDVGCGRQQYRKFLGSRQYCGVDWTLASQPPAVAEVTRLPFRDRTFDSALCTEVLEHLPEPGRCLDEIRRVVKPGGMVLFTVPMTMYTHSEPYDFYRYTEYGLRYLLEKHGYEILTLRRLGGVVSVMATHGISLGCDAIATRLERSAFKRIRRAVLLPVSTCSSVIGYWMSRLIDRFDRQDAIGWAAMCRTKG